MKRLNFFLWTFAIIAFLSSCSQDSIEESTYSSEFTVSFEEAREFAKDYFELKSKGGVTLRSDWEGESITFNGVDELPGLHIFNYQNEEVNSFVIISGDRRIAPILAEGDNDFPFDYIPFGVADWMQHEIQFIDHLRTTNKIQEENIKELWETKFLLEEENPDCCQECPNWPECIPDPSIGCGANADTICDGSGSGPGSGSGNNDDNPCGNNVYTEYGPLLDTQWSQGCVYNENCPVNSSCSCEHEVTGCVATSMAQVINYFEYPDTYDYSSLLPRYTQFMFGASGAAEIATLMDDCGVAVDKESNDCSTGANTGKVNDALEDVFNYAYGGDYGDYSGSEDVKLNIRANKPVIFAGNREEVTFMFTWGYKGGHAWVCDGYKERRNQCNSYLQYSMNWGWNGSFNGWFSHSSWSPGGSHYQYNKRVLLNIEP